MKINKYDNYVVLADDRGGFSDFVPFLIKQVETNFKGENLVIDLLNYQALHLPF